VPRLAGIVLREVEVISTDGIDRPVEWGCPDPHDAHDAALA
jgi:hypothetical protein